MVQLPRETRPAPAAWMGAPGEPGDYSISEAAALLGVSRVTIWRWHRAGRLPITRSGHRTARIARVDLERIVAGPGSALTAARSLLAPVGDNGNGHAPRSDWQELGAREHVVQFYEADTVLVDSVAEFVGAALRAGDAGIVIATTPHRQDIHERLAAAGLDPDTAAAEGRYVALDAADTLSRFMIGDAPDAGRFRAVVGDVIARAAAGGRRVRAFGEMVALLAVAGNQAAAIRLERLWNDLQQELPFALLCAYPMNQLGGEALAAMLDDVCAAHSQVMPAESYTALPTTDDRLRAVTALQQKARWLEAEIAERERAEERLREALAAERAAREQAEAALRARDEFLSIAAHELKTPLTSLSGYAQLVRRRFMRDGRMDPERVEHALDVIENRASTLARLLNQLLDVSRLEDGKLSLERQPADLTDLVERVVLNVQAGSERHTITLTAPDTLPACVDALRLEQVLTNLLDNAIKYSPDGGPIDVVLAQPEPATVELAVRDRGIGIPPEKRDAIFERFYQAHHDGHRSGWGLGLYISQQIVELHGGDIRAEFPPDGGTRFVVRLPLAPAERAA